MAGWSAGIVASGAAQDTAPVEASEAEAAVPEGTEGEGEAAQAAEPAQAVSPAGKAGKAGKSDTRSVQESVAAKVEGKGAKPKAQAKPPPAQEPQEEPQEEEPAEPQEEQEEPPDDDPARMAREVEEAARAGKEPAKPEKLKFKVPKKLPDGRTVQEEVELAPEQVQDLVAKRRSLDDQAFKWSREAAELRKQMEAVKTAPVEELLKARGIDPWEFSLQNVQRVAELGNMTPEQRQAFELQQQRAQIEQEKAEWQRQQAQAQRQAQVRELEQYVVQNMPAALEKNGLPEHPLTYELMRAIGEAQMAERGLDRPDFESAAEAAKDFGFQWLRQVAATMDANELSQAFPEIAKKLRTSDVKRAAAGPTRIIPAGTLKQPAVTTAASGQKPPLFNNRSKGWLNGIVRS